MSSLIKSFHLIAILHYLFGLYYYVTFVSEKEIVHRNYEFGGLFVYLTYLSFMIHAFYFTLSSLNDFFGSIKVSINNRPLITRFRDYCFASFAFPLAVSVAGMFWLLYTIDRELVFPKTLDAFFPWWLNIFVHVNIIVFMLAEMILLHHKYPSRKSGITGLGTFMLGYLIWVHYIKYKSGHWVYLVLNVFTFVQRNLFFMAVMPLGISFYYVGEYLNKIIWSEQRVLRESSPSREFKVVHNKMKTNKSC